MPPHPATLNWINSELAALAAQDLRRTTAARLGRQGPVIHLNDQVLVNFGSNDYLGLASDRRIVDAICDCLDLSGWGAGASPLLGGRSDIHGELEFRLAEFEGTEAALLFNSGYAANCGAIAALVGPGDGVFTDRKNHASILDGCRLSRADVRVYRHGDAEHLDALLSRAFAASRRLVVTESVFSMDGDIAPLRALADVAERHAAMLMVDEAHATGVFGIKGRGAAESLGVEDGVAIRVGTMSKALGSIGGFVAGSRLLVDWLINRARPYVFSTAMPAAMAAAGLAALAIVGQEPGRRQALLSRACDVRNRLAALGWNTAQSTSQIIPLLVGEPQRALSLSARLRQAGFYVPAIRPPTVPDGESCLRISLTAAHTDEMIDGLIAALGTAP